MKKKRWTKNEEDYLIENYTINSTKNISHILGRTHKSIMRKAEEMKIQKSNKERRRLLMLSSKISSFYDKPINYFIAGFIAGEGCFTKGFNKYKCPHFIFKIVVSIKDEWIIKEANKEFGSCGTITFRKREKEHWEDLISLAVTSHLKIYTHLIPFMEKFLLCSNKMEQFEEWKKEFYDYYNLNKGV